MPLALPSPWRLPLHLALLAGLVVLAIVSASVTLGFSYRYLAPQLALRFDGDNSAALAALAQQQLTDARTPADRAEAGRNAVAALRRDPTSTGAVSTLGLVADANGDKRRAARLMAYSAGISHRDLATRLWLIEEAVNRGDVRGALRHYDVALRTSNTAPTLLFPVLVSAAEDPELAGPIADLLAQRPEWGVAYLDQMTGRGNPVATAALFAALARRGAPPRPELEPVVAQRLLEAGRIDAAWNMFSALHPDRARSRLRDPGFAANVVAPTLFDWQLASSYDVSATPAETDAGKGLSVAGDATESGAAARQLVRLPPGRWQLRWRIVGDASAAEAARWEWACAAGASATAAAPVTATTLTFTFPAGCEGGWLTLQAPANEPPIAVTIAGLSLSPA